MNTVYNYETNMTQPYFRCLSKIIDFLGYGPYSPPQSLEERLTMVRKFLGVSQRVLAAMMGIDPSTIHKEMFNVLYSKIYLIRRILMLSHFHINEISLPINNVKLSFCREPKKVVRGFKNALFSVKALNSEYFS